jgi:hypothetical protein
VGHIVTWVWQGGVGVCMHVSSLLLQLLACFVCVHLLFFAYVFFYQHGVMCCTCIAHKGNQELTATRLAWVVAGLAGCVLHCLGADPLNACLQQCMNVPQCLVRFGASVLLDVVAAVCVVCIGLCAYCGSAR